MEICYVHIIYFFFSLKVCARRAVATATQCISASQASYSYNSNPATRATLSDDTKDLADHIPPLIDSIKANSEHPQDTCQQSELMYVAEVFLHVSRLIFSNPHSMAFDIFFK